MLIVSKTDNIILIKIPFLMSKQFYFIIIESNERNKELVEW